MHLKNQLGNNMKKLLAGIALSALSLSAFAVDYGTLYLNQLFTFAVPQGSAPFSDTAQFATTVANGPVTVTVSGSLHISSGSGRGAGYHTEYNVVDIDSVTVTDDAGNTLCAPTESIVTTAYGGRQYSSWTCNATNVPAGLYKIAFTGHIVSTGNMSSTVGYGRIVVSAQ
jgi:hypothetical protein